MCRIVQRMMHYVHFIVLRLWCILSFTKTDGELKNSVKNWVYFSVLKRKYRKFIKTYPVQVNQKHEYSTKIWWCWLQGEENAPDICKVALASLRKNLPDKKIIILTNDNLCDYVDFPDFIQEKFRTGRISQAHFSDLLRVQLLIQYGGIWIDSTVLCTGPIDFALNTPLFTFKNIERGDPSIVSSSWFISAEKNNPILMLTRDLLFEYWKKHARLFHYFLFHFFFTLATEKYKNEWNEMPFYTNLTPHILQRELFMPFSEKRFLQIKQMTSIHKLTHKFNVDKKIEGTFLEYLLGDEIVK